MNIQQSVLTQLTAGSGATLYELVAQDGFEVLLTSAPGMIDIYNNPEFVGVSFQQKLSRVIKDVLRLIDNKTNTKLSQVIKTAPLDVLYLLRGGLNFNLHVNLAEAVSRLPEVTFLSSQRVEANNGFEVSESAYQKWSIQDGALLCVGDISATGTTIRHALDSALAQYATEGKKPKWLFVITIGTSDLISELLKYKQKLTDAWGPTFQGMSILFLDAVFSLYRGTPLLSATHLPFTDFFRKDTPRTPEFERISLSHPICFLERCAIYDGGSRAFEPNLYLGNLCTYWEKLSKENVLDIRQLLALKTDLLDYQRPFDEWKITKMWWHTLTDGAINELHELGAQAVCSLLSRSLEEVCEERLAQLSALKGETNMDVHYIDKLAWINILDKRILSTRSKGKDTYYIPGGKREKGETDHEALIREVREELNINLLPETIEYVGTFEAQAHGQPEGVKVRMTCYSGKYAGDICASSEVEEVVWFVHKDKERSSPVDKIIFDWLKEMNLIE